ncbi:MAG: OmpA family protein [Bacteroidota bacterium]
MNRLSFRSCLLLCALPLLLVSCLSKKKHLEALQLQQRQSDAKFQQEVGLRDSQLNVAHKDIDELRLQLAERKGENNILVGLRKELEAQIGRLETDIENMSNRSSSTQKNLSASIKEKDTEIAQLKGLIQQVDTTLSRHVAALEELSNTVYTELQYLDPEKFELITNKHQVRFSVQNDLLFRARSVVRLEEDTALPLLEKVANVILKYPNMSVNIIGHTSNAPPRRKADVDNWNVSAQRAATIIRVLVEDYDLNPSQLLLAAKGEFSPRASNETEIGKSQNQRIEFVVAPQAEALERAIRKVIE